MNAIQLKGKLIGIRDNDYSARSTYDLEETAWAMMRHIGNTDPVLRDELIYRTFLKWTLKEAIPPETMKQILWTSLDDDHLFYRIGETGTDSVFTRSFSILIVPLAMYLNEKKDYLVKEDVHRIQDNVTEYLEREKDVRGYVEGKGWAHSTAHGADALEDLARSEHVGREGLMTLLAAIRSKTCIDGYTYAHEEDERLAAAALSICNRKVLAPDDIVKWITDFGSIKKQGMDSRDYPIYLNTRNFLRSLYFKLLPQAEYTILTDALLVTLDRLKT